MTSPFPGQCDLLVAGGGVAGLPAAVAAARLGASTLLVEREAFLGGMGVSALHRYICGLYLNGPDAPVDTLNAGITREIVDRLRNLSPASHPVRLGRAWVFPFEPRHLQTVYSDLARIESSLAIMPSTTVQGVSCESGRIRSVTLQTPDGIVELTPSAVIDCTGEGTVIRLSGTPYELAPERERQIAGCTLELDGIEGDRDFIGVKIAWHLARLPAGGKTALPLFAGFAPGPGAQDGFCKLSLPAGLGIKAATQLDELLARLHALLAERLPELRNSRVTRHSGMMERDGIRLAGEWELDETSIIEARTFPDDVVRNAWPIEFWDSTGVPSYSYPPDGAYYGIPVRCLRSRAIRNLFASGRCISASNRSLASTRVMGTCMSLGEAAGIEAALFTQKNLI